MSVVLHDSVWRRTKQWDESTNATKILWDEKNPLLYRF